MMPWMDISCRVVALEQFQCNLGLLGGCESSRPRRKQAGKPRFSREAQARVVRFFQKRTEKALFWLLLTGLALLAVTGCARHEPPAPVVIAMTPCARPVAPELPQLGGVGLLESRAGYAALLTRDQSLRAYIAALRDALTCYERQIPTGEDVHDRR